MNSQLGLINVWTQGDWVTKTVALVLITMSLASWMVIIIKALDILKCKKLAGNAEDFWHSEDFAIGLAKLGSDDSNPFRQLALAGREASAHHRNTKVQLHDTLDASDWITRSLRNSIGLLSIGEKGKDGGPPATPGRRRGSACSATCRRTTRLSYGGARPRRSPCSPSAPRVTA